MSGQCRRVWASMVISVRDRSKLLDTLRAKRQPPRRKTAHNRRMSSVLHSRVRHRCLSCSFWWIECVEERDDDDDMTCEGY